MIKIYDVENHTPLPEGVRLAMYHAASYAEKKLKIENQEILIGFVDKIENSGLEDSIQYAQCRYDRKENYFLIHIVADKENDYIEALECLFHELTHVKQFAKEDLMQLESDDWRWKGKIYRDPKTFEEYEKVPWEREANKIAKKFLTNYLVKLSDTPIISWIKLTFERIWS